MKGGLETVSSARPGLGEMICGLEPVESCQEAQHRCRTCEEESGLEPGDGEGSPALLLGSRGGIRPRARGRGGKPSLLLGGHEGIRPRARGGGVKPSFVARVAWRNLAWNQGRRREARFCFWGQMEESGTEPGEEEGSPDLLLWWRFGFRPRARGGGGKPSFVAGVAWRNLA